MAEYVPPVSPDVDFVFKGTTYVPPASPNVDFVLGADDSGGGESALLRTNYMMILMM